MKHYEAIIIGGGGGLKLRPIANMGHKVAIIEKEDLGGTCLNRGCIPSKMLIHKADWMHEFKKHGYYHFDFEGRVKPNFTDIVSLTTQSVRGTSASIEEAYEENQNVDFYHGHARFVLDKVVEVNGEQLTANKIFIATGTRPRIPKIEGLEGTPYWTSREALRNTKKPNTMVVIGGGYIAMELGYFYAGMGVEISYLVRSGILKAEDNEIREEFLRGFPDKNFVHQASEAVRVEYKPYDDGGDIDGDFTVTYLQDGEEKFACGEALLIATGIVPNTNDLGLENTKIELDEKGYIQVNDHLETNVPGVYALGDCIGNYFFRHSVNFEGEYLLRTLYEEADNYSEKERPIIQYPAMPHAVFSNPQIGGVGKTEEELIEEGVDYIKGVNPYKSSAYGGDVLKSQFGLVKLLFDRDSHKLLGAHIVGKEASSMIHMCIAYINMGATLEDMLDRTIYIHPAFPEVIRNACRKAKVELIT